MDLTLRDAAEMMPNCPVAADGVPEQLNRILAANGFKNSRRYSTFLRHVVERTLNGRSHEIKERNLGVEVFGRSANYDTASDPVVRITAGEVRRRLAQYYDNPSHTGELRIELPCGSYVPEFRLPSNVQLTAAPESSLKTSLIGTTPLQSPVVEKQPNFMSLRAGWLLIPAVFLSFAIGIYGGLISGKKQSDLFWRPFVAAASSPVIISVGEHGLLYDERHEVRRETYLTTPGTDDNLRSSTTVHELIDHNTVSWADAVTAARLGGYIQAQGKSFSIRRSGLTPLSDLRRAPSVLVGGFNNKWIMHLMAGLRFSYRHTELNSLYWIQDKQNLSDRSWSVDTATPPAQFTRDFGIVARFWDSTAENPTVVASGMASYGTLAAGELLTTAGYLDLLSKKAAKGWEKKNIEIVFSTAIIDGNIGPPKVLATYTW